MAEDHSPRRPPSGGAAEGDLELPVGLGPAWRALGRAGQIAAVVVVLAIAIALVRIALAAAEGHDRTVTERTTVTAPPVTVTRTVTAPATP